VRRRFIAILGLCALTALIMAFAPPAFWSALTNLL
jgi:hypothetical protein